MVLVRTPPGWEATMQSVCPRFVDSQDSGPHDPNGGDGKLLPTARGDELVPALPTAPWLHKAFFV